MPLWIVVFALIAFHWPGTYTPLSHTTGTALGFVLFIMGLMLDSDRLKAILRSPWQTLLGSLGKWVIAPAVSILLAWLFFGLHSALGIALRTIWPALQRSVQPVASILSALALYVVVLGVVAPASGPLRAHANELIAVGVCVVLQIVFQMIFGYLYARWMKFGDAASRTMIFEVGICNTALAAVLATSAFGPLAGVAAMANMVCNLTIGSLVAVVLSGISVRSGETGQHACWQ